MSRLTNISWIAGVMALCLTACSTDDNADTNDLSNKIVVEAYVYANERIDHVKISKIHTEGLADAIPVEGAGVQVTQGNNVFLLYQSDTIPGLYQQAITDSLFPNGNENLHLQIYTQNNNYNAHCYMPMLVTGLTISNSNIQIIPGDESQTVATLTWDAMPAGTSFAIFVRHIPSEPDHVEFYAPDQDDNPFLDIVHTNMVELKSAHFRYYGSYQLYVTAVSQEYEVFYDQPSAGMANAAGNIENGWGIFTAFYGSTVNVSVQ